MMTFAFHPIRTEDARDIHIHPDGEHGKQFNFKAWLARRGEY